MTGTREHLESLYARVPSMTCIPGCTDCCCHITWSRVEIEGLTVDQQAVRQQLTYACPFMEWGVGCTIHPQRALICRMFGTNPLMRCPRGAASESQMTPAETLEMLETYKREYF